MALLVDKFAPTCLDDMILMPDIKSTLEQMIQDPVNKFGNMTLCGMPGIGKTALAKALVKQIKAECLFLNASKDNSVDVIRSKVSDFCGSVSIMDQIKIVILDEADCLSVGKAGAAGSQEVLRGLIEEHQDDCRFILTCNYVNRIIPALISRCPIINIQFTPEMVLERIVKIIKQEKIKCDKASLKIFFDSIIKAQFPKIRNILHAFDICVNADKTFNIKNLSSCKVDDSELDTIVKQIVSYIKKKNMVNLRQYYLDNEATFERNYEDLANHLFNKFEDNPVAQILIADYIFKMSSVADPEIQFYAMCLDIAKDL